ncbi:MAG: MFS transporter [Ancrocorticia sp.]|uniref:MFS transporter n=1 Tax=Ancrocorticia sp. TaxID=2593684 RepID=UPI003F929368
MAEIPLPKLRSDADYRWWFAGDTTVALGSGIGSFALTLLIVHTTGSSALAGTVDSITMAIAVLLVPFSGVMIDRYDRRKLLIWNALTGALVWGIIAVIAAANSLPSWILIVVAVLIGVRAGMLAGTSDACLKRIAGKERFPEAMAANQSRDSMLELVSQPLSGALYGLWAPLAFIGTVLGYLTQWVSAVKIKADLRPNVRLDGEPEEVGEKQRPSIWKEAGAGIRWIFSHKVVRGLVLMNWVMAFAGGGASLAVVYGLSARGTEPALIGLVVAGQAITAIIGSFLVSRLVRRFSAGKLLAMAAVWVGGTNVIAALASSSFIALLIILAIGGFVGPSSGRSLGASPWCPSPTTIREGLVPHKPCLPERPPQYRLPLWESLCSSFRCWLR